LTISCRTAPKLTRWDFSHWSRSTSSTCAGSRSPVLWISPQTPLRRRTPPAGRDPSPPRCCCWPADPQYAIEDQGRGSPQGSGPCIPRARPEAGLSEPLPRVVPRRPLPSPETHIMAFTLRTWGHRLLVSVSFFTEKRTDTNNPITVYMKQQRSRRRVRDGALIDAPRTLGHEDNVVRLKPLGSWTSREYSQAA